MAEPASDDFEQQLTKLARLKEAKVITEDEFNDKKKVILERISSVKAPQSAVSEKPPTRKGNWFAVGFCILLFAALGVRMLYLRSPEMFSNLGQPSVVGVYQLKWPGYQQENTKTLDLHSDGVCIYTPHTAERGGYSGLTGAPVIHTDDEPDQATWTFRDGIVYVSFHGRPPIQFKLEGNDLIGIPEGTRFIKIR